MSIALIAGIIVLVAIVGIALVQRSRPRVTIIETKRDEHDDQGDRNA